MTGLTSYIYNFISSKVDRTKNSKSTNKQQDFFLNKQTIRT